MQTLVWTNHSPSFISSSSNSKFKQFWFWPLVLGSFEVVFAYSQINLQVFMSLCLNWSKSWLFSVIVSFFYQFWRNFSDIFGEILNFGRHRVNFLILWSISEPKRSNFAAIMMQFNKNCPVLINLDPVMMISKNLVHFWSIWSNKGFFRRFF